MALPITFVKISHNNWSVCAVLPLLVMGDCADLVPNVSSKRWSTHYKNLGSMAVNSSTSITNTLILLSLGSICAAAMEKSKNNPQSFFWKLVSFFIISFNHTLNSFGVWLPLLGHYITA